MMLNLYDLAERPLARNTDPAPSHLAATEIRRELPALQSWVMGLLRDHPGLTASELAQAAGVGDVRKINRRLPELERTGKAFRGDMRVCRVSGRNAQPWYPVEGE